MQNLTLHFGNSYCGISFEQDFTILKSFVMTRGGFHYKAKLKIILVLT
ncbi:hypothetical protein [Helicobacter ganmani]